MLIKFLQDVTVQDKTRRHYSKGCIVEMADDACRHFVTRKKAEFYTKPKISKPLAGVEYSEEAAAVLDVNGAEDISETVFDDAENSISKKKRKRRK